MNTYDPAALLVAQYGGHEQFHGTQTGISPDRLRWAVHVGGQTIPMPSYRHATAYALVSGGRAEPWPGTVQEHTAALERLRARVEPETLAWLDKPATEES